KSIKLITMITICVICVMLLFVYRSIVTVLLVLVMMFIELAAARGIVAALGYYDLIGLSTFAVNLLTTLANAAAILPIARHSIGDRHARRRRSGADHGACPADHLQPVRPVRSEAGVEDSRLAPGRYRRGAVAGPHPRRVGGSGSGRSAGTSVVRAELQRPPLP